MKILYPLAALGLLVLAPVCVWWLSSGACSRVLGVDLGLALLVSAVVAIGASVWVHR